MSITLAQLKTQARQRADMEDNNFISDSELTNYINNSIAELHDILVQAYSSDYSIETYEFSTVVDDPDYALPADFYKLRGVDAKLNGSDWYALLPFNFNERNKFDDFGVWSFLGIGSVRYRLVGNNLRFSPTPDKAVDIRMWYIPTAPELSDDADTYVNYNGYDEYVIVDAAIKMKLKEESDVSELYQIKSDLLRRIEEASQNRDAANPESVVDIYESNNDYRYFTKG